MMDDLADVEDLHSFTNYNNILELIDDNPQLLGGDTLYPVQRFVLKLIYGLPLEDQKLSIRIPKTWRNVGSTKPNSHYEFTEQEYLEYLYDQGRCNINEITVSPRKVFLCTGRRDGKTTLSSLLLLEELRRILTHPNPQNHYHLPFASSISIKALSPNRQLCRHLSDLFRHLIHTFELHRQGEIGQDQAAFKTLQNRLNGQRETINVTFDCSYSTSFGTTFSSIVDEVNFNRDEYVFRNHYNNVSPNIEALGDGKFVVLTTPSAKEGFFYNKFTSFMERSNPTELAIQIPTWEMNPSLTYIDYDGMYEGLTPSVFYNEYGGKFRDI